MDRLTPQRVAEENGHFKGAPRIVWRGRAKQCDPWSAQRGYTAVVRYEDPATGWQADYGYHRPTRKWVLWAN